MKHKVRLAASSVLTDAAAWTTGNCPDQASHTDASAIAADVNTASSTSTAHTQGEDAATSAWDEAEGLGFPANVYIDYDLEGFAAPNSTCVSASESYISGWDAELESLGGTPAFTDQPALRTCPRSPQPVRPIRRHSHIAASNALRDTTCAAGDLRVVAGYGPGLQQVLSAWLPDSAPTPR